MIPAHSGHAKCVQLCSTKPNRSTDNDQAYQFFEKANVEDDRTESKRSLFPNLQKTC